MNAEPTAILIRINHGQRVRSGDGPLLSAKHHCASKGCLHRSPPAARVHVLDLDPAGAKVLNESSTHRGVAARRVGDQSCAANLSCHRSSSARDWQCTY